MPTYPYKPTPSDRRTVQEMIFAGITPPQIAACIGPNGISEPCLWKYFRRELETYHKEAINRVAKRVYEIALARDEVRTCPVCKQSGYAPVVVKRQKPRKTAKGTAAPKDPEWELVDSNEVCWLCDGKRFIVLKGDNKSAIPAALFILKCRGRWRENPEFDDSVSALVKRVVGVSEAEVRGEAAE